VIPASRLEDIADAILDGTPVDWTLVDAQTSHQDEALVEQLKTLAALRQVARERPASGGFGTRYWGHLQVFERIGEGAYGAVHRAWDTRLDREVALKLLAPGAVEADSEGSSIIEEGRLLARVRHANVVTIYGAERIDGCIGLWMELVNGRTLEQALREGRTFTADEVIRIGQELSHAVTAVHAAGLVHRDIKAQNVMLADDGRLVLMDFGTGREAANLADTHVAGTPLYLAPEALAGEPATTQSDVYSIGVVLYRLLTGSYPVTARDLADLRRAHQAGERRDLRTQRIGIPRRLRQVVERAVASNPSERYATAESLAAALAALKRAPGSFGWASRVAAAALILVGGTAAWYFGFRGSVFGGQRATAAPTAAGVIAATPVIVVLPFRNVSSDPGSDDFVDGLTSAVIRNLAVIDGLRVRSETSSFFFKNKAIDLRAIGKQLDVNYAVEADVQRVGKRLRVNAQLVSIAGDVVLVLGPFDRTLDDVFAIQDEISLAIVNKLRLTLGRGQRRYRTNAAAYDQYLRGLGLVSQGGTKNANLAAEAFEQVMALDPQFAPAHAGLVSAYAKGSWQLNGMTFEAGLAAMRPHAMRALELDPLLAEAHGAMGLVFSREFDWENARKSFDRAIELNPTLTEILIDYADSTLLPLGQAARAESLLIAAIPGDPLSLALRRELGLVQIVAGRYDDAVANLRDVVSSDPDFQFAANLLARALTLSGRPDEAIALFESRPEYGPWERWLMPAYVKTGRSADVGRLVGLRDPEPSRQVLIYAALGDRARTLDALERAADVVPQRIVLWLGYPELAFLRDDPRYLRLLTQFHLR
jgi:serine/threonine-protein kinase